MVEDTADAVTIPSPKKEAESAFVACDAEISKDVIKEPVPSVKEEPETCVSF